MEEGSLLCRAQPPSIGQLSLLVGNSSVSVYVFMFPPPPHSGLRPLFYWRVIFSFSPALFILSWKCQQTLIDAFFISTSVLRDGERLGGFFQEALRTGWIQRPRDHLSVCLPMYLSVYLFMYLSMYLPTYLFIVSLER